MNKLKKDQLYLDSYFNNILYVLDNIDKSKIIKMIRYLAYLKKRKGRLFLLGVGGSAANCSHAVNDFRKICNIEAYTPTDNISELTARTNDDGWETTFVNWLKVSRLSKKDIILVLSVGGGNIDKKISMNIVNALKYAKKMDVKIMGIIGSSNGYTASIADVFICINTKKRKMTTPLTESFQALMCHAIVTHPLISNL